MRLTAFNALRALSCPVRHIKCISCITNRVLLLLWSQSGYTLSSSLEWSLTREKGFCWFFDYFSSCKEPIIAETPIWQCKPSVPVDVIGNPSTPQSFSMFNHWSGDLVCEIRLAYCQHQLQTLDTAPDCHVAVNLCSVTNANPIDGG